MDVWVGAGALMSFTWLSASIGVSDLRTRTLPTRMLDLLVGLGLVLALTFPGLPGFAESLEAAVIGLLAGYGSLWLLNATYVLVKKQDGIGSGDFLLAAGIGTWLGWYALPWIALIGGLFTLGFRDPRPFGSGLALGAIGWAVGHALYALFH